MWCRQQSVNHQELLCSLHCATTVVLREQLNFKSAVIRSERSSCLCICVPVYLCICVGLLSVWGFRYVCGRLFLERGIFTHLFRPFICVKLIISVHGCFTAVTVRHEPSRIVAVRTNLATRLGSSRSVNFFSGRCTLPEVHFFYPFSRHDFRCDGRDSR